MNKVNFFNFDIYLSDTYSPDIPTLELTSDTKNFKPISIDWGDGKIDEAIGKIVFQDPNYYTISPGSANTYDKIGEYNLVQKIEYDGDILSIPGKSKVWDKPLLDYSFATNSVSIKLKNDIPPNSIVNCYLTWSDGSVKITQTLSNFNKEATYKFQNPIGTNKLSIESEAVITNKYINLLGKEVIGLISKTKLEGIEYVYKTEANDIVVNDYSWLIVIFLIIIFILLVICIILFFKKRL